MAIADLKSEFDGLLVIAGRHRDEKFGLRFDADVPFGLDKNDGAGL